MSEQSPEISAIELQKAKKLVPKRAIYRHYKDPSHLYEIIGHTVFEEDDDILINYRPLYGDFPFESSRRFSVFTSMVQVEGVEVPRFTRVDHELIQTPQLSELQTPDQDFV